MQSGNAEIGVSIDSGTLSTLPSATRYSIQMVALASGVSMPLTDNSAVGRNTPNFSVTGARTSQNNLQINGVDANDISAHDFASVAIPAPESISEIVVKTLCMTPRWPSWRQRAISHQDWHQFCARRCL